uniref:Major facilitator superfamily (MFS) profile domain-containing protein n=1 Tax=Timema tahoe TaxID=61484 RepID=A0A7R9IP70_9NEOP|nr:unnamed protein product [Timema tahoe]
MSCEFKTNADELQGLDSKENIKEDEARSGSKFKQYLAAIICSILPFAQGTVVGWPSTTLPLLQSEDNPIGSTPMTEEDASWIGSLICIGAILSVPVFSYLVNNQSRKMAGYIAAMPLIPSWLLVIFANSKNMLHSARFIAGLSCGGGTVVIPLFVAEISEDSVRGALSTLTVLFFNGGILFAYCAGSYFRFHSLACICLTLVILFIVCFYFVPESPVFLMSRNRQNEAARSLRWLRGDDQGAISTEIAKLRRISQENRERMEAMGLKEALLSRATIKGLTIGLGLCLNQQLSGLYAVLVYTVNIFQESGSSVSPYVATILVGILQIFGSYIASLLVDRAGRRVLLVFSNLCMTTCLGCLGSYFYLKQSTDVSAYGWVPVVSLSTFIVAVSVGPGALFFLIVSEVFSERVRNIATTLCVCSLWLLMFLVGKFFSGAGRLQVEKPKPAAFITGKIMNGREVSPGYQRHYTDSKLSTDFSRDNNGREEGVVKGNSIHIEVTTCADMSHVSYFVIRGT